MPHRALLVDDERLARKRLRALLAGFPEVEVVGEADSVPSALAAIASCQPNVVFLDIQMPGQSGFEFLERAQGQFHTVFVTAYDQFAVRAFEVNGLDYLMKPVELERLGRAIRRIPGNHEVAQVREKLEPGDYVFSGSRFLQVRNIQCILAAGAYSEVFAEGEGKWMVLRSMKEWEDRLPRKQFVRIHRSALVNLDFVHRLEHLPNHSCHVFLRDWKRPLWMSRRCATALREQMR